jgi:Flp pilus assembly pilin Flp
VTWTSRPDRPIRWVRAALGGWGLRSGQGIVEYGLILSLSAALAVILLVFFGGTLSAVLNAVGDAIDAAS